jgi:hypothetical protein
MAQSEGFGALLQRLVERRQLDLDVWARSADVGESELVSLLRGGVPSPSLLRRLAPALGLHPPDLFVFAGVDVPDDLAPLDHTAGSRVPKLVMRAVALPLEQRNDLRGFVASLPHEARELPVPVPAAFERYPEGAGAVLMRLARNRNLGWTAVAKTLLVVTGRYWSAATYGGVGRGTTHVTADLLDDFCAVLDVPSADLVEVSGIALPNSRAKATTTAASVAGLIWEVRRLTHRQVDEVRSLAESMQ